MWPIRSSESTIDNTWRAPWAWTSDLYADCSRTIACAQRRVGPARAPRGRRAGAAPAGKPKFQLGQLFLTEQRETHYLRQVLVRPHLLREVDIACGDRSSCRSSWTSDFGVAEDRMLFGRLRALVYAGTYTGADDLLRELDDSSAQRLSQLLEEPDDASRAGRMSRAAETADSLALSDVELPGRVRPPPDERPQTGP